MTVLEKGVASVACASGMAALTNALLNIVGSGQEIIASTSLYGGTIELGADIVINSTSKYINGNSSAISGVLTDGVLQSARYGDSWSSHGACFCDHESAEDSADRIQYR